MLYPSALSLIGNTPLLPCPSLSSTDHPVLLKLEGQNPTGSLKDRIVLPLLREQDPSGKTVLTADWGPFALSAAWVCRLLGLPCRCILPVDAPSFVLKKLRVLGAEVQLERGSLSRLRQIAERLAHEDSCCFLDPWSSGENPMAYCDGLAQELWQETSGAADGRIAAVVAPTDTCGCLMGCSTGLKMRDPQIAAVAAAPSGFELFGLTDPTGPQDPYLYVPQLTDQICRCSLAEACAQRDRLWEQEGIACGLAGGAALAAVPKVKTEKEGSIVVILPSRYELY